jgi:hypothetical protein
MARTATAGLSIKRYAMDGHVRAPYSGRKWLKNVEIALPTPTGEGALE